MTQTNWVRRMPLLYQDMTYRTAGEEYSLKNKQGYFPATTILLVYYTPELRLVDHGDTGMKALEVLTRELVDGVLIRQGPAPLGG